MSERRLRLRLGLFVLAALAGLVFLLFLFGRAPRLFVPSSQYTVIFPEAPGVKPGTPVRRSGVRVGEVTDLDLDPQTGLVRLTLSLDTRHAPRANEDITITRNFISGDASIDFVPEDPEKRPPDLGEPLPPGAEVAGVPPPSPRTLLAQASDVLPTVQQSLDQIRRSVQRFEGAAPRLEEALVAIRDLSRAGGELVPEMRRTNDEFRALLGGVRESRPELRRINEQLQALMANTNNFVEELRQVVQVNEPQFARAVKEFTETVDRIGETFSEENRKNLNTSLGNVARASENFEKLTVSSDEALQQVRKMLQRLDESLTRADEVIRNLRDITKPAAERSERITANADATLERLNALLADVHAVVRLAARSDGTLQRLLGDPRLYAQLEAAACGVVKLIPRLEGVLADLEVFADKIARHPELLGVGGAVRPSGGLKEAPHAPIAYPR